MDGSVLPTASVRIEGVSKLLMSNVQGADPANRYAKLLAPLTSKRKKTDEDRAEIDWLGWRSRLYLDGSGAVSVPMSNVVKTLIEGARLTRQGKAVERGVVALSEHVDVFEFPDFGTGPEALFGDGESAYVDRRMVAVQRQRVPRVRPGFLTWAAEFRLGLILKAIDPDDVNEFLRVAGPAIGLCDGRTIGMGRFAVTRFAMNA